MKVLFPAAGLAIVGTVVLFLGGCGHPQTPVDPYALPPGDWEIFKRTFISPEGRVIDTINDRVSHSEGQGYGMLIAEAYGDRDTFDRLWNWTRENLQTREQDHLLSWLWRPSEEGGAIADPNNATDGDILVSWALLRAFERWGDFSHQQAAMVILADVREWLTVRIGDQPFLLPGREGFQKENGYVLNPSYWIFPAFDALEHFLPGSGWSDYNLPAEDLLNRIGFGEWHLPPDWVFVFLDMQAEPAPDFPPVFGYNAVRIPLHLAWHRPGSPLLKPYAEFWQQFGKDKPIPDTVNLITGEFGQYAAISGVAAIAKLAIASYSNTPLTVSDIPPVEKDEAYYSACLKILVKIAIHETRPGVAGGHSS